METEELRGWLRLSCTPGIGPATARRLLAAFGLPAAVFAQPPAALEALLGPGQRAALAAPPAELEPLVAAASAWLAAARPADPPRRIVCLADAAYPPGLLEIEDPPLLLYYLGGPARDATPEAARQWYAQAFGHSVAIVGSRNPTPQGALNARQFALALARAGLTVVSGLALGVDGAAHAGALDAAADQPGRPATVAVVGTGLDLVYPGAHQALARRIAGQGLLLSEYPLGTPPVAANFPRRNRLIAGIARGTLVVEAALRSGSLITARLAAEQGREVFAIPGSIHSAQSRGCHALLRQGAKLVETAQDVLEELGVAAAPPPPAAPPARERADELLLLLGFDPVSLDALQARCGLPTDRLQARLTEYELAGQVARLPGGLFQRIAMA